MQTIFSIGNKKMMICTKVVKYVVSNLYFVTLSDNLSLSMNLFHEDKSVGKACPIEYDRFCVIAIYRMSRRTYNGEHLLSSELVYTIVIRILANIIVDSVR